MAADRFDLIIANVHDFISGDNIISLRTALHGVTRSKLDLARMQWQARLSVPGKALLSVLIGGAMVVSASGFERRKYWRHS